MSLPVRFPPQRVPAVSGQSWSAEPAARPKAKTVIAYTWHEDARRISSIPERRAKSRAHAKGTQWISAKRVALPVVALLLAVSARAGDAPKPKSRSLAEFASTILNEGKEKPLSDALSQSVGLTGEVPAKAVRFKETACPDGHEHAFHVIYEKASDQTLKPAKFFWTISKKKMVNGEKYLDLNSFLVSLDGKLIAAGKIGGKATEADLQQLPLDSAKVRKSFAAERKFYISESLKLDYHEK